MAWQNYFEDTYGLHWQSHWRQEINPNLPPTPRGVVTLSVCNNTCIEIPLDMLEALIAQIEIMSKDNPVDVAYHASVDAYFLAYDEGVCALGIMFMDKFTLHYATLKTLVEKAVKDLVEATWISDLE